MGHKYVDVHCHLFNKDILSRWLRILIAVAESEPFVPTSNWLNADLKRASHLDFLKRLKMFLDIGTKEDSTAVYDEMIKTYGGAYRSVPLMLDIAYISTADEYKAMMEEFLKEDWLLSRLDSLVDNLRDNSDDRGKKELAGIEAIREAAREVKEMYYGFKEHARKVKGEMLIPVFDVRNSFQTQIDQLTALKNKCGDMVYPFLSVDPRRPDILEIVKKLVGRENIFHGIKLYPPIGFSPTDPVLFGDGGLYAYCQEKRIPVTSHCSLGGFATYADKATVSGHIYDVKTNALRKVSNQTIEFECHFFPQVHKAIEERAQTLNNPDIWKLVVERYPDLYLNLAHLGGKSEDWRTKILNMMDDKNRLYSDLACHTNPLVLQSIKAKIFDGQLSPAMSRIMYGSDYYILILFTSDFGKYLHSFEETFASCFDAISAVNAEEFLFKRG